ncbi:AraC family transcriptional regulator [Tenacibaculum litopenaei]|uniref:helix-turn-helix domain-containing protein n=1 Tax=Tenacibaculum litopenaei TaxID=396016 RepID=UPI0038932F37
MQHFKTISDYYKAIGLSVPKHSQFDVKSFEENMGIVFSKMEPFRHEFYFIAVKIEGKGETLLGHNPDLPDGITIFFNSPFQIISWDHSQDWSGFYIIFSQDFIASSFHFDRLLDDYSFLKIDESIPIKIGKNDLPEVMALYKKIKEEYTSDNKDKFDFIQVYVLQLLNQIKRLFNKKIEVDRINERIHRTDLKLLSQFQKHIKESFYPDTKIVGQVNFHSPSYYASILNIHPNHLNAVVKSITGQTALNTIHTHILKLAKAELLQTAKSVKEIAYQLHFDSPSHFGAFFKKHTGSTPITYRKNK